MTRVFSGIQPTGQKHLGNYIGAIRHYVIDQDLGDAFYCVVDLHSISQPYDHHTLREHTLDTAAALLAAGLDPDRCTLFVQSHVHEHAEGCVAPGRARDLRGAAADDPVQGKGRGAGLGVG